MRTSIRGLGRIAEVVLVTGASIALATTLVAAYQQPTLGDEVAPVALKARHTNDDIYRKLTLIEMKLNDLSGPSSLSTFDSAIDIGGPSWARSLDSKLSAICKEVLEYDSICYF